MPDQATTVTVIDACGRARVPSLLWGLPGGGKSSLVRGLAAANGVPCEVLTGSIREPADFGGLPVIMDDGVVLVPPAFAKRLRSAGGGYLLLDELTTCPPAVQGAMLIIVLDRIVGDVQLPDGVTIVAAANRPDQAADGWDLAPPLANRFCHLDYRSTPAEFTTGITTGWSAPPASRAIASSKQRQAAQRAAVAGFIHTAPHLLHNMPATAAEAGKAWPSPRTWTMMADTLAHVRDDDPEARAAIIYGLVGEGAGIEFTSWLKNADLPDPAEVLADPSIVDWADRPDRVWAVLSGVVALSVSAGTKVAWTDAWRPVIAAADGGAPDVAAVAVRMLARARPAQASVPAAARRFAPILTAAGLNGTGPEA